MKVGILTIQSNVNIGNRLQNYALQETLKRMGIESESIPREIVDLKTTVKRIIRSLIKKDRKTKIHEFNKRIRWSKYVVTKDFTSEGLSKHYDAIVIGSDQVWNPYFPFSSDSDYLPGINVKKIAYAASFGVNEIKEQPLFNHISKLIKGIDQISVREYSAQKLALQLSERSVPVVLDPTLLLTDDEWKSIEKKPYILIPDGYILKYMLGKGNEYIDSISKKYNLPIIDISNNELPIGPEEFIYLVNHAKLVCTDSFHACAFSLNLKIPFVIVDRISEDVDMSSRMDTLCDMFSVWNKRLSDENFDNNKVFEVNRFSIEEILNLKRQESIHYLDNTIKNFN